MNSSVFAAALFLPITLLQAADDFPAREPVKGLSAAESLKTMQLPPGYRLDLVLSEPEIQEPVAIAFDGNGRMFVAEMLSYMQDIDGTAELESVSRVSLHWASKGDGVFDRHTVFADKLLLPRIILPLGEGQCVIGETNTLDLYLHTDTDGDGVADKKDLWFAGGPRGGNLEHQPSGLVWALDNTLYTTYNAFRLRWTPQGVKKEPAAANNGQWGLGQDDRGHLYFMNAGGERGPQSFQTPTAYGAYNPKNQFAPGFDEVWPLAGVRDFQGGLGRVREPAGTLNHFTATSGAEIYRGDRLPAELRGNLFFGEPVGRLVRRAEVTVTDGLTVLSNPYQGDRSEFLRSTDLCFRPLNMATAPDGTLYIVDMYRGIIQEGNWVREGSYLRKVVAQYGFQHVTDRGRVWRLMHQTTQLGPQPRMYGETPAQLVRHLSHPNGWWRDTAQKLLVLSQDRAVVPALTALVRSAPEPLTQVHALWTLEGLNALDPVLVREKLKDPQPQVRIAAVRVSETLVKNGDSSLRGDVLALAQDADAAVALQAMLTARLLGWPEHQALLTSAAASSSFSGVKQLAGEAINVGSAPEPAVKLSPAQKKTLRAGGEIYNTLCAACHGPDGRGVAMVGAPLGTLLAPALAGSKTVVGRPEASIYVLLHGLIGDIDGKKYEGLMVSMATNDDAWIANVLCFVRNSFGNHASFIAPADVARLRAATKSRTQPWTIEELRAAIPQPLPRKDWKVSASHNSVSAGAAIDKDLGSRFDTRASQEPGQWFLIELPQTQQVCGLELDAASSTRDYPRGYRVELSLDGKTWGAPVATGQGSAALTSIEFSPAPAKFVRITQTGAVKGLFWSIHDLQVFAPATAMAARP